MPTSQYHWPRRTICTLRSSMGSPHSMSGNDVGASASRQYHCTEAPIVMPSASSGADGSPYFDRASRPMLHSAPASTPSVASPVQSAKRRLRTVICR